MCIGLSVSSLQFHTKTDVQPGCLTLEYQYLSTWRNELLCIVHSRQRRYRELQENYAHTVQNAAGGTALNVARAVQVSNQQDLFR